MPRADRIRVAGLVVAAVVPYLNALGNGFTFDDRGVILENPMVREVATPLRDFFTLPFYPGGLYRPLTFLSYWLNQQLHPLAPFGFHLVNIVLHALVTVLLYALCRSLRLGAAVSFVAALVFAVHPIHTEAVTSVVGRAELFAAAAVLGALLCAQRSRLRPRRVPWLIAATMLFIVGLLSKESAFVFLPLLVVTAWMSARAPLVSVLRSLFASGELPLFCTVAGAYLALRWAIFGTLTVAPLISVLDNPLAHTTVWVRIGTALVVLVESLAQLVVPLRLSADYSFNEIPLVESMLDPRLLVGLVLLGLIGILVWRYRAETPALSGAALFFLAAYSLTSNLLFPIGTIRGERLLYLPSAGLCILAGLAGGWALRRRPIAATAGVLLLLSALAGRTWERNPDWASELTLFRATAEAAPYSAKAHHNLGAALAKMQRHDEAALAFRRALQIYPDYDEAAFGIGCAYQARGMKAGALHWYAEALRIDPKHAKAHLNRGVIFYNDGELAAAERSFREGLGLNPGDPRLLTGIGFVRLAQGRVDDAKVVLQQAEEIAPNDPETRRAMQFAAQHTTGLMKGS